MKMVKIDLRSLTRSTPVMLGLILLLGVGGAAYLINANQPVTVTAAPFTVSMTSSAPSTTCSGSTVITCTGISIPVGGTETLTASISYASQTSVTFTASSSNPSIATISPTGPLTITAASQTFTVTGVSVGSTSISVSFT